MSNSNSATQRRMFLVGKKLMRAQERLAAREDYRNGKPARWNASLVYQKEYDRQKELHVGGFYTVPAKLPWTTPTCTLREDA